VSDTMQSTTAVRLRWDEQDDVWLAELDEDRRCHTYGRTLVDVDRNAREAVALWKNADVDSLDIHYDLDLPDNVSSLVDDVQHLRQDLNRLHDTLAPRQQEAARRLVEDLGLSYRDAARLLGISHQRVAQLVRGSKGAAP
jgi:DNA-directed RNA polymerase specialized sigma24 family protein